MLIRKVNEVGQKDRHIQSIEDRALPMRNWIRQQDINGFCCDLDMVKWKRVGDELVPCCLMELTRTDDSSVGTGYLKAITDRYFVRELQGRILEKMSKVLKVPAFIILFNGELRWLWVYHLVDNKWRQYTKEEWADYLRQL